MDRTVQALAITRSEHGRALARLEADSKETRTVLGRHTVLLHQIISMLDRAIGPGDARA